MSAIAPCPHCLTRIIATASGTCPACGRSLSAPVEAPPPPPERAPRHPILFTLCIVPIVAGFWRYGTRPKDDLQAIIIDLALIWAGCIGVIGLSALRWRWRPKGTGTTTDHRA